MASKKTAPAEPEKVEGSDPNESVQDERQDAPGFIGEEKLTTEAVIQRRTSTIDGGPEWPADGRYHKLYNVAVPRVSTGYLPDVDWTADEHTSMHNANKVATLQEALNRGLHPTEPATFEGTYGEFDEASGSAALHYAVKVVPATEDPDEAASAYVPSKALEDLGGSTLPEFNGQDERR